MPTKSFSFPPNSCSSQSPIVGLLHSPDPPLVSHKLFVIYQSVDIINDLSRVWHFPRCDFLSPQPSWGLLLSPLPECPPASSHLQPPSRRGCGAGSGGFKPLPYRWVGKKWWCLHLSPSYADDRDHGLSYLLSLFILVGFAEHMKKYPLYVTNRNSKPMCIYAFIGISWCFNINIIMHFSF